MSKRYHDSAIWEDDWFCELPPEHKLFWFYIKDNCDHAGIWKPKIKMFSALTSTEINLETALSLFNNGKTRIRILDNGYWLLEDFCYFQYMGKKQNINLNNRLHESVIDLYIKHKIPISSIRGIENITDKDGEILSPSEFEVKLRSNKGLNRGMLEVKYGVKDKDKGKYEEEYNIETDSFI